MRHPTALFSLISILLLLATSAVAQKPTLPGDSPQSPLYVPTGERMYKQYCSSCHGLDAKGHGPASATLKLPPPDLTTLAQRHGGKFPYDYVSGLLLFGPGLKAHGTSEMPAWGPVFMFLDKQNEAVVRQRIRNLSEYLASLQEKEVVIPAAARIGTATTSEPAAHMLHKPVRIGAVIRVLPSE
jgi:mono/diheme cytochrome c family protein